MTVRALVAATALAVAGGGAAVAATSDSVARTGSSPTQHGHHAAPVTDAAGSHRLHRKASRAPLGGLPRIRGTVGPGFTIEVSRDRAPAGRYKLVVRDLSSDHNWHIDGRRVDKRTRIGGTGRWVWKVRLRPGTYAIFCDPHSTSMRTTLRVVD